MNRGTQRSRFETPWTKKNNLNLLFLQNEIKNTNSLFNIGINEQFNKILNH